MADNSKEYDRVHDSGNYDVKSVYDHIIRIRMRYLNNMNGNLLDFGFGNGVLSEYFTEEGFNVYGLESSKVALKKLHLSASSRGLSKKNFILIDHTDSEIPFDSNFFSVIISNQVLYFLQDRYQIDNLIKDCFRVLKKGGKAVFTIMAEDNYYFTKFGINPMPKKGLAEIKVRGRFDRDYQLYRFENRYDIQNCFEQAGFIIDDVGYFDFRILDVEKAKHYIILAHKPHV